MAIAAVLPERHLHGQRAAMTVLTSDVLVRTIERETGLHVMIKHPLRPRDGVVAEGTLLSEATVMCVILSMTIDAHLGCVAEHVRFVA